MSRICSRVGYWGQAVLDDIIDLDLHENSPERSSMRVLNAEFATVESRRCDNVLYCIGRMSCDNPTVSKSNTKQWPPYNSVINAVAVT